MFKKQKLQKKKEKTTTTYVAEKKEKNDSYTWVMSFKRTCEPDVCILRNSSINVQHIRIFFVIYIFVYTCTRSFLFLDTSKFHIYIYIYKFGKFAQIYNILGQLARIIHIFFLLLAFFKYQACLFFTLWEKTYLQKCHYFLMPCNQKPDTT